ncbi:MAG: nucleotidyltransferase family protein [bacterium]
MKALILAGGRGKRLDETTEQNHKCLIELRGRSLIEFSLDAASSLEQIEEIIIVVGFRAEDIINRFGIEYKGKKIQYVIQREQKGLVHAIECAVPLLGESDFLLMLGDEIMVNPKQGDMLDFFSNGNLFGVCGIVHEPDKAKISRTYSIMQNEDARIFRLIEKPRNPLNNLKGTGNCVFKNEIISLIERTPINPNRNEKELPDLIQCAIDDGKVVKSFVVCDHYTNINSNKELMEIVNTFPLE